MLSFLRVTNVVKMHRAKHLHNQEVNEILRSRSRVSYPAEIACPLRNASSGSKYIWGEALHSYKASLNPQLSAGMSVTHTETQFDIDTTKAVPTPLLDVGENVFAAQLLRIYIIQPL